MKFAVMMHTNPAHSKALSEEEVSAIEVKHAKLLEELEAAGEVINGAGLHLPEETTTIRIAAGRPVSSTGPVAAGDEHVTAYYLLECPDRDRAVEIASRILDSHVTASRCGRRTTRPDWTSFCPPSPFEVFRPRPLLAEEARYCDRRMDRFVIDPSWLGDVPPPRRPLLLFDGG